MRADAVEVALEVQKIQDYLQEKKVSNLHGDELSAAAVTLALYKMTVGTFVADTESELETQENARYFSSREDGLSQEDAKRKARLDLADQRKELNALEYMHRNLGDLISALQSRVKALAEERKDTNFEAQK